MMLRTFGLTPLARPLLGLTSPLMKGRKVLWAQLGLHWQEIVGPSWASQTSPERLVFPTEKVSRGILHLAIWGTSPLELAYEAAYFCEKVNQYFGFAAVHQIKWRVTPPPIPRLQRSAPAPKPVLSSTERNWISDKTQGIEGALGQALSLLGETLLRDQK